MRRLPNELEETRALARNPGTSAEVLARLAGHGDWKTRRLVAANPSTPAEVLAALARDVDPGVRQAAAQNPRTPPEALTRLAEDWSWMARKGVAENPGTLPDVLARLAGDRDVEVMKAAVCGGLRRVLENSGATDLYAALGEDPLQWGEERQRQLLRELGEDA